MKKISKISHLVIAFIFAITYLLPGGMRALGAEPNGGELVRIESVSVGGSGTLKKGDTFNLDVYAMISGGNPSNENVKVYVSGASTTDGTSQVSKVGDKYKISVRGLIYNGNGNTAQVEVLYGKASDTSTVDLKVESTVTAGAALKLTDTTIHNVVAGQTQQVSFTLKNTSESRTKEGTMKLSIINKNSTSKGIQLKRTSFDLSELLPDETKEFNVTLAIDKDVTRGIHEMEVDIEGTKQIIKLKVDSDFMPPSLEVTATGTDGFKINQPKDITIGLKNVGNIAARNVKVEVVSDPKINVMDGSNVRYVESIPSKQSQSVKIRLQVNSAATSSIPVQLKFSYTDDLGEKREDSQYIYLLTSGGVTNTEVNIVDIKGPTGTYGVDNNFEVSFAVTAKKGAKNIKISVAGDTGIVPKTQNLFMIDKLEAGQKKQFKVTLAATKAAANSSHPIEIKAEYKNNDEAIVFSQFTSANITNPEAEENGEGDKTPKGLPKVIIGEYKSNPVVVKAGEEFDLDLGFLNTNSTKSVHNLKANLTVKEVGEKDTGSVFTPVGASNTFFIADLAPRQTGVKKIRLYTIPSAKPKTYEITIEMEYEDDKGNPIKATENIGIPVEQVTKLEIADIQTDSGAQVGMPMSLTANIYNTGKTDISNVSIHIEGEGFDVQENKMFIGNFEKGASEQYMPTLIANQTGELTGKIIIEYEDPTGSMQKVSQDFNVEVMEMPPMPDGGENGEMTPIPEEKPAKWPTIVGIIGGFGLAALIAFGVVKKRNAKLAEKAFDEE